MLQIPPSTFEEKQPKNVVKFNVYVGENELKGWAKRKEKKKARNWKYNRRIRKRSFKMDNWTINDMIYLLRVYKLYGNHWQDMCCLFRCQKDWQMKNRVFSLIRKALRTMLRLSGKQFDITCTKEILKLNTDALIAGTNTVFYFENHNTPYIMLDVIERYAFMDYFDEEYKPSESESGALKEILEYFHYLNEHIIEEDDRFWKGKLKVVKKVCFKFRKSLMTLKDFMIKRRDDFTKACDDIRKIKITEREAPQNLDTKIKIITNENGMMLKTKEEEGIKEEPVFIEKKREQPREKPKNKLEEMGIFPIRTTSDSTNLWDKIFIEKPVSNKIKKLSMPYAPISKPMPIKNCFSFTFSKAEFK